MPKRAYCCLLLPAAASFFLLHLSCCYWCCCLLLPDAATASAVCWPNSTQKCISDATDAYYCLLLPAAASCHICLQHLSCCYCCCFCCLLLPVAATGTAECWPNSKQKCISDACSCRFTPRNSLNRNLIFQLKHTTFCILYFAATANSKQKVAAYCCQLNLSSCYHQDLQRRRLQAGPDLLLLLLLPTAACCLLLLQLPASACCYVYCCLLLPAAACCCLLLPAAACCCLHSTHIS